MILLKLALKSLQNRLLTTILTLISISLSVALLLSVEKMRVSTEEGFTQTISQVDLIVGAKTSPLSLLMYTVFNIGNATNNVSGEAYQFFLNHKDVEWGIPYSLGDSHKGYRVVGTNENFFKHYRYRGDQNLQMASGEPFSKIWDVVVGAEVAEKLKYKLGDPIVITHGVTKGDGFLEHDDKPFQITGILKKTGTILDQSVYVTLEGFEGIHMDWKDGLPPQHGHEHETEYESEHEAEHESEHEHEHEHLNREDVQGPQITAFFLRTKNRVQILALQREINVYKGEALLAIIPGVALAELWKNLNYVEKTLTVVSVMVIFVGFVAMLIAILTSLNERRREMAILRSLGLSSEKLIFLFVLESALLTFAGLILGYALSFMLVLAVGPWAEREFGVYISNRPPTQIELLYLLGTFVIGILIGLLPALRARNMALKDGLSQRL